MNARHPEVSLTGVVINKRKVSRKLVRGPLPFRTAEIGCYIFNICSSLSDALLAFAGLL